MAVRRFKPRSSARFVVITDQGIRTTCEIGKQGTLVSARSTHLPVLPIFVVNPTPPANVNQSVHEEGENYGQSLPPPNTFPYIPLDDEEDHPPKTQDSATLFSIQNLLC
jgi:hypothetical protein